MPGRRGERIGRAEQEPSSARHLAPGPHARRFATRPRKHVTAEVLSRPSVAAVLVKRPNPYGPAQPSHADGPDTFHVQREQRTGGRLAQRNVETQFGEAHLQSALLPVLAYPGEESRWEGPGRVEALQVPLRQSLPVEGDVHLIGILAIGPKGLEGAGPRRLQRDAFRPRRLRSRGRRTGRTRSPCIGGGGGARGRRGQEKYKRTRAHEVSRSMRAAISRAAVYARLRSLEASAHSDRGWTVRTISFRRGTTP